MQNQFRQISVSGAEGDWLLTHEGNPLLTPQKRKLHIPSRALAEAVADEWRGVKDYSTKAMPLSAMVFTAIDVVPPNFERMVDALLAYAETDLLFYRSEHPELRARQDKGWDPILDWVCERYECELKVTEGVMPVQQPYATLARIRRLLQTMDPYRMSAFTVLTQALSSLMLALSVKERQKDAEDAFKLSRIDEDFQAERWGEDSIALARAREIERDVHAATRFFRLMEGG